MNLSSIEPWGVERTETTNWVGPMRESGDGKVKEIVCSTDREDLKPEVVYRNDRRADLIAAAPELLLAVIALIEDYELEYGERHCDCRTEPENEGHTCNICIARSAVKKASGEVSDVR
jgi:hypothetical protein